MSADLVRMFFTFVPLDECTNALSLQRKCRVSSMRFAIASFALKNKARIRDTQKK
jgi:hypothetical protein